MSETDDPRGQAQQWGRGGSAWQRPGGQPPDPLPDPSAAPPLPPELAGSPYAGGPQHGIRASGLPPLPPEPPPDPEPPTPPIPPVPPVPVPPVPGPIDPGGLGPPHSSAPRPSIPYPDPVPADAPDPSGLGPPHSASTGGDAPEPSGLGPPHSASTSGDAPAPAGLGPPHLLGDAPTPEGEPGVDTLTASAPPPAVPPWLRTTDPTAPPGSPGRVSDAPPGMPTPPPTWAPPAPPLPPTAPAATTTTPPPRLFGEQMATGVLLTLAGGSVAAGSILALIATGSMSFTTKALVSGGAAAVLLAAAVVLRLVRGSEDLRGMFAVVGIAFAVTCVAFAYDPAGATDHDNFVKYALGAGVVSVLGWFTCIAVPSAVAGFLAALALPSAVAVGVFLSLESPTQVQLYVSSLGTGLVLAVILPRFAVLRPHPTGLGWALAGAVVAVTGGAIQLITRGDATAVACGATAAAGLLLLAQRHRHLPAALGALAGFAALEAELVNRYITDNADSAATPPMHALIAVAAAGGLLIVLVAAGVLLSARGRLRLRWPVAAIRPAEILLAASLALALVSLVTGPGDVPFNPPQLSTTTALTHAAQPHAPLALR